MREKKAILSNKNISFAEISLIVGQLDIHDGLYYDTLDLYYHGKCDLLQYCLNEAKAD